jgi:GntR family transcriptional regulator
MSVLRFDRRSLTSQVRNRIWQMMQEDQLTPGDRLPSEQELVDIFGVSRTTVREALKTLEEERVIICHQGVGRFVAPNPDGVLSQHITHLKSVTDMAGDLGISLNTKVLSVRVESPDDKVRARLNLEDHKVVILERVRMSDSHPFIYSVDVFSNDLVQGELIPSRFEGSLLSIMEGEWGIYLAYSKAMISAEMLDYKLCQAINVADSIPWILLEQVHYDAQHRPVLYSKDYHRGDRFHFRLIRRRK